MDVVVEIVSRGLKVLERIKFNGEQLRLGRSYYNDVILDDPHVCAHHAILRQNEHGELVIDDCDSINGIRNEKRTPLRSGSSLNSGDTLLLGKTYIRVYQSTHPVAPTIALTRFENLLHWLSRPLAAALLLAMSLIAVTLYFYLGSTKEFELSNFKSPLVGLSVSILIWCCIWALIGRISRHDARFITHLNLLLTTLLVTLAHELIGDIIRYNSSNVVYMIFDYGLMGLILATLLWSQLYISTHVTRLRRWIMSHGIAWSLVGVALVMNWNSDDFSKYPSYSSLVKPPLLRLAPASSLDEFQTQSARQFELAAEMAAEED